MNAIMIRWFLKDEISLKLTSGELGVLVVVLTVVAPLEVLVTVVVSTITSGWTTISWEEWQELDSSVIVDSDESEGYILGFLLLLSGRACLIRCIIGEASGDGVAILSGSSFGRTWKWFPMLYL